MQWLNEPPEWRDDNGTLTVQSAGQTDFWRITHDGGIRDHGHFYYRSVEGDFVATVQVAGAYQDQYDQAGLMVRQDEKTWLKCGIELKDGVRYASVVVTRDWSDWSVVRLDEPDTISLRIRRHDNTFEVAYSLPGQSLAMLRQTFLTDAPQLDVGPMIASPTGSGFQAVFTDFSVQSDSPR